MKLLTCIALARLEQHPRDRSSRSCRKEKIAMLYYRLYFMNAAGGITSFSELEAEVE
jgi:hypothetical protein